MNWELIWQVVIGIGGCLIWLVLWIALIDCIWEDRLGEWAKRGKKGKVNMTNVVSIGSKVTIDGEDYD